MNWNVTDMHKFKLMLFLAMLWVAFGQAQQVSERAYRILQSQFPESASALLQEKLDNVRRLRYYRTVEGTETTYSATFKKDRLHYGMVFNSTGILTDINFRVKKVDVPAESWDSLYSSLDKRFEKFRIRKIYQRYRVSEGQNNEYIFKNAFQNLMLPEMLYDVSLSGRTLAGKSDHEALFDASGKLLNLRNALPANYDHILY